MVELEFTDDNFEAEVLKSKGLVLVDFYAPWCGPCKMMAPIIDKLAEEYKEKVKIGKLNVDDNVESGEKFEIQSIPTLILFKDGEMVEKMIGFQSEENIREKLEAHV